MRDACLHLRRGGRVRRECNNQGSETKGARTYGKAVRCRHGTVEAGECTEIHVRGLHPSGGRLAEYVSNGRGREGKLLHIAHAWGSWRFAGTTNPPTGILMLSRRTPNHQRSEHQSSLPHGRQRRKKGTRTESPRSVSALSPCSLPCLVHAEPSLTA